ncbi:MAG: M1 family metallopeptidase [Bacteroidota bacterium]|nr:M1 family metallopeptidase [Bacteroidota bacterium]
MEILFHIYPKKQLLLICLMIIWTFSEVSSQDYFQQEVNYKIEVTLNDKQHELNAFETIEYINNSPDTLRFLFFHLWPNGYSGNNTALARQLFTFHGKGRLFNNPALKGYIDSLNFKVDDELVQWDLLPGQPDICKIMLNKYLKPGDTLKITTPFHVKIPQGVISRLGHIGESYQISQWYPKPAVYDKTGWHQISYLEQGEFYSEFGSFDVSITLPANYIVGATGNLQNEKEAEMLDKLAADSTWKSTLGYGNADFPPSSEQFKTLRYTEKQVHDFAWFADKRFHVLKGKVKLPDSGREVTTWAMFTNEQAGLWKDALQYENNALWYFSKWNGDYPYHSFTVVQSAMSEVDGMEYPGIALIGPAKDAYFLDEVIAHETAHNWFYSVLGSDERRYPFMDEGVTSAYEMRYMNERYPGKKLWEVYLKNKKLAEFFHIGKMPVQRMRELDWLVLARKNLEQPINLSSTDYNYLNYSLIVYNKAAMGFTYLRAYLGDSIFDSTMHDYYRKWKFKHPQPDDLRSMFESHTGKDLTWFFSDFLGSTKQIDYKVINFKKQQLLVKNNGELASPLVISGIKGDSIYFEKWVDGFVGERWIDIPQGNYSEIKIDPKHVMPELFRLNNNIRKSGIFRKADPIRPQLLFTIENTDIRTVMYIPAVNWNKEDGFMVGVTMHNGFIVTKPIEYFVMPFYSIKNPSLAGFGRVLFNITPYHNFIRMATVSLEGTKFGAPGNQNYYKAKVGLDLHLRTYKVNNPLRHKAFGYYIAASNLFQIEFLKKAKMNNYLQLGYQLEKTGLINPFSLLTLFESHQSFQKTSVEFNYKLNYYGRNNGLDIRLFAGTMLKNTSNAPFYAFSASGRSGRELYLYQGFYPDRFSKFPKTFWSRQMTISEGGLVSAINDSLGYSNRLLSITMTSSLPGKSGRIPIKPFVSFLLNDHGLGAGYHSPFFYEAGLKAGIWNFFEIHVPLLVSRNIESISGSLKNRIRITFNLNSFNQIRLRNKSL